MRSKHVTVCVCTYKRLSMLERLLRALERQHTYCGYTYTVIVVDNDAERSAEGLVQELASELELEIEYQCEPRKNIAMARNAAVRAADGDHIAFLDDDEYPVDEWLSRHLHVLSEYPCDGVLGPVRPDYETAPPVWVSRGKFCDRPEYPTGTTLQAAQCRSGNVVFRRSILQENPEPFDPRLGTGGEDVDFFSRMASAGHAFVWCNEAVAYESVPAERLTSGYMLRRALLRGKNNLTLSREKWRLIGTSALAIPVYVSIMPLAALLGWHWFMRYSIRCCDHAGRLLALCGMHPLTERDA